MAIVAWGVSIYLSVVWIALDDIDQSKCEAPLESATTVDFESAEFVGFCVSVCVEKMRPTID